MLVFLIAAISVDGYIAQTSDQVSTAWTSSADAAWFSDRTKQAGVMVMGSATFATIGRALPGRETIVLSSKPPAAEMPRVRFSQLAPAELIKELAAAGHQEVAICGGATIYTKFLQAGLVHKLYLTVEPKLFGDGVKLFNDQIDAQLSLVGVEHLSDQTIRLEYDVTYASHQS